MDIHESDYYIRKQPPFGFRALGFGSGSASLNCSIRMARSLYVLVESRLLRPGMKAELLSDRILAPANEVVVVIVGIVVDANGNASDEHLDCFAYVERRRLRRGEEWRRRRAGEEGGGRVKEEEDGRG